MAVYATYLLGLVIVGMWLWRRPHMGLKSLLGLWLLGLSLQVQLLPSLAGFLLFKAGLPIPIPMPAMSLEASKWAGGILMLRALMGLTLWDRPTRRREYIWAGAFAASLVLAPIAHAGEGLVMLLTGLFVHYSFLNWLFLALALPWLWSFRWREKTPAWGLLVALTAALISFAVLLGNYTLLPTMEGEAVRMKQGVSISFSTSYGWVKVSHSGLLGLAWQVKNYCEIYALLTLLSLVSHFRLFIRRISLRMVGSHLLAALIPAVLAVFFTLIAVALFLATYRASVAARYTADVSKDLSKELRRSLAQKIALGGNDTGFIFANQWPGQITIVRQGDAPALVIGGPFTGASPDSLLLVEEPTHATPLLLIGPNLFVSARLDTIMRGETIRVEGLIPIDSLWMADMSNTIGRSVRIHPQYVFAGDSFAFTDVGLEPSAKSLGPASTSKHGVPGVGTVGCSWWKGGTWEEAGVMISSDASLEEPLLALQKTLADGSPFAYFQLITLVLIAFVFVAAGWWIGLMVLDMGRGITKAVRALTAGTSAVGRGELDHRIAIEGKDELWSVAASFNQMAEGLEKVRQMEIEKERLEKELEIARQVQQNLFPKELPTSPGWEFAAVCRPAREVGGDYYDLFEISQDEIAFALGDVSGKGLGPSLLMSNVQAMIRTGLRQSASDIGHFTSDLNGHLLSSTSADMFITLFVGVLNTKTGRLRYVNGGHNPPMLLTAVGREPGTLRRGGPLVGIIPGVHFDQGEALLEPGSLLVLFSDGITEATDESGEMFGEERLIEALKDARSLHASSVLAQIIESVDRFAGKSEQADDMSVVVVRNHGANRAEGPCLGGIEECPRARAE